MCNGESENISIALVNPSHLVSFSCFSQVGRFYGMQQLNLATDCDSLEVVVHELLHALGFLHEHNRLDRDDYVYVNFTNLMGCK